MKGIFRKGASDPFVIEDVMVPYFENPSATKAASQQFNASSIMQYATHDQMNRLKKATAYNPLLTVIPQKDRWTMAIEKSQNEHKYVEEQIVRHLDDVRKSDAQADLSVPIDSFINESRLIKQMTTAIRSKPCFLFAGPGISLAAPSCAPSWSKLMSDVLDETLKAVPEEHQHIAAELRDSESARRPEEAMDTFYFILRDKLFDLFKLLSKGSPNINHKTIAKMAKEGKVKTILTTNFDEFIEQALNQEGVEYKVVCTNEEFKLYYENGCNKFAVLKIHGTVSRPETILAVSSHYKTSGGFAGYKTLVTHNFIEKFPTLFFGYSGWDFAHANYQEFWDAVGRKGGENIYFMRFKGSTGGPLLSKLIGRHVGDRLVIGEGSLPETAISLWERFDPHGAKRLMTIHMDTPLMSSDIIKAKQREYIKFFVHQIPMCSLLAILWNESINSNEDTKIKLEQMRKKRMEKDAAPTIMSATTTDGVTSHLVDLATKFAHGIISNDVYLQKQQQATIELSLGSLAIPKRKKNKLITLCSEAFRKHPLLKGSHDYQFMLPSYLLSIADVADDRVTPIEYLNEAIDYIVDVLEPLSLRKDDDKEAMILYDLYHTQANILRVPESDRKQIHELFQKFADDALTEEWSEEKMNTHKQEVIIPTVSRIAFHQIDTSYIISSIVKYILQTDESGDESTSNIVEGAHIIALTLHKQAVYHVNDLFKYNDIQNLLQIFNVDVNKQIPDSDFKRIETKLNQNVQVVIDLMAVIDKRRIHDLVVSPHEVISTFDLATSELLRLFFRNSSTLLVDERRRESCGYYPRDIVPPGVGTYLSRKVLKASKSIGDERAVQVSLGMLCALGESVNDMKQMINAVDKSIQFTEGKVTETTPYPIPEALAAQFQARDDFAGALHYYKMSLEGIRTFIPKQKTDAIVLNACLVQAQFDLKEALKMAFKFSPHFNEAQMYSVIGPARGILVQQCIVWAQKIGMTLDEAQERLMNREDEVTDFVFVDGQPTVEKVDTDSTDEVEKPKSRNVVIEEPPETKKKKKRMKKVKKSTYVTGIASTSERQYSAKSTVKQIKGDKKDSEKCSIM